MHSGGCFSELTDGFAMGVTALVTMVGLPASNILQRCRLLLRKPEDPAKWATPALPDASAGEWPDDVKVGLATMVVGLSFAPFEEERMPLADALEQLEKLCACHSIGEEATAAALAAEREARQPPSECVVCLDAPRQQRFACGHLLCCTDCVQQLLSSSLCPTCRAPLSLINNDKAQGAQGFGGAEATFELPVTKKPPTDKIQVLDQVAVAPARAAPTQMAAPTPMAPTGDRAEQVRGGAGRGRGRGRGRGGRGGL
jgi:hypothetical protein